MPLQKPISCIISRSYSVRILMRWASSNLPVLLEPDDALVEFLADRAQGAASLSCRGDELLGGIEREHRQLRRARGR